VRFYDVKGGDLEMIFFHRKKSRTGLALGSGAARGLAHIGVLKALKEKNISIDMIAGSSIGALVGAYYARETEIAGLEEIVLKTDWRQLVRLVDPNLALLMKGIIHGNKVKELLRTLIGDIKFKDLKIPFAVVATDVDTGREIVIKQGSVIEAVRASISIPAIFMPVRFSHPEVSIFGEKDRFLIDGGIVNPVPVSVVKGMGATFVIACNVIRVPVTKRSLTQSASLKTKRDLMLEKQNSILRQSIPGNENIASLVLKLDKKIKSLIYENKYMFENVQRFISKFKRKIYKETQRTYADTPNIFETVMQAIYTMEYEMTKLKVKEADLVINPNTSNIALLEFYKSKEAILEGYKAAKRLFSKNRYLKNI
jgi:NTE family protein